VTLDTFFFLHCPPIDDAGATTRIISNEVAFIPRTMYAHFFFSASFKLARRKAPSKRRELFFAASLFASSTFPPGKEKNVSIFSSSISRAKCAIYFSPPEVIFAVLSFLLSFSLSPTLKSTLPPSDSVSNDDETNERDATESVFLLAPPLSLQEKTCVNEFLELNQNSLLSL
jgi:hypothetical protein